MRTAKVIAKGSLADVAAAAATHALRLERHEMHFDPFGRPEVVGWVSADRAEMLERRVHAWFQASHEAPFPLGSLLWFRIEEVES